MTDPNPEPTTETTKTTDEVLDDSNQEEIQKELDEKEREKFRHLSIVLGIDKQNEEIDNIKGSINKIAEKITEIANVITAQNEVINNLTQGETQQTTTTQTNDVDQLQKIELLSKLAESELGKAIIKKIIGGDAPPPSNAPLISQEWLNEKMKNSVMENFQLGETILDSVKNSLKKKAVQNITNAALTDTGLDKHEPA